MCWTKIPFSLRKYKNLLFIINHAAKLSASHTFQSPDPNHEKQLVGKLAQKHKSGGFITPASSSFTLSVPESSAMLEMWPTHTCIDHTVLLDYLHGSPAWNSPKSNSILLSIWSSILCLCSPTQGSLTRIIHLPKTGYDCQDWWINLVEKCTACN